MKQQPIFDAHLDLAYLALRGRDMIAPLNPEQAPHPPASVTLQSLAEGRVTHCLATIFTEGGGDEPGIGFEHGDGRGAMSAGLSQLAVYREWHNDGRIVFLNEVGEASLRAGILMECADPILEPDDLESWSRWGVVAVGMSWAHESRYAGGNNTHVGLKDLGRALVPIADELGIVHDLSHLSQRATDDLLTLTDAPVMASHSNCRALLDGKTQRHVSDDTIREIASRGGVIGLNLCANFLKQGITRDQTASIDDCVRHVEHMCEVVGHRRAVGLGTDMDGGFSAFHLPDRIDQPRDLHLIFAALAERGWTSEELADFAFGNWARFWGVE